MNKILIGIIILLCLVFGVALYLYGNFNSSYYAVYLSSGDLYFGKLSRFPRLSLTDAWFLERGGAQESVKIASFSEAFWQPQGKVFLNKNNIVWMAPLGAESRIIEYMKNTRPSESPKVDVVPLPRE